MTNRLTFALPVFSHWSDGRGQRSGSHGWASRGQPLGTAVGVSLQGRWGPSGLFPESWVPPLYVRTATVLSLQGSTRARRHLDAGRPAGGGWGLVAAWSVGVRARARRRWPNCCLN